MPRRTIQCRHCGYFQLKRDRECDQCGAPTAEAERRERAWLYGFGFRLLLMVGFLAFVWKVIPGGAG